MCRVFLYSRVSTSQQTLAQQERAACEWLNAHSMSVDEVVSDEGVSGGISYADRNLGKILLPKTKEGDMIIVSEISRLGRSMFDLAKLIHTELKPRKLRLVVSNMGIDLNCSKMTAIDELILNNFSFAAQLEKQLISERTLSALAVKKSQGIKIGAASEKYKDNFNNKTMEEKQEIFNKRGKLKRERFLESPTVRAFIRVLKNVFPEQTLDDDISKWDWERINLKYDQRQQMLALVRDYKAIDPTLFRKFDGSEKDENTLRILWYSIKRSAITIKKRSV